MVSEIVEAKRFHCGQMVRRLREGHAAILTGASIDAHQALVGIFDASAWRRAWLLDGKLMALAGVEGPLCTAAGEIWLAVADAALDHPFLTALTIRSQLEVLAIFKRQLWATVIKEDQVSVRMARRLGFSVDHDAEVAGTPAFIMSFKAGPR